MLVAAAALSTVRTAAIDAAVERELARQHTSAASIAIARDGEIVYSKGYGQADSALNVPADAQTIYAIGSVTKQFTAALIMRLVEQGRIALDAKVSQYLPDAPHAAEISVRYLLDQRSGLPDYLGSSDVMSYLFDTRVTPAQLVALVAKKPLDFPPGSKFVYSNTNYVLLGMIVERVTGQSYADYLNQSILAPLQLTSTTYSIPVAAPRVAVGEQWDDSTKVQEPVARWTSQLAYAAGALNSDVVDLIAWDTAFFGGKVVSPGSVREMTTPPALPSTGADGYAFGWIVGSVYGRTEIWHNGGIPGFAARNAFFPSEHLAIVVLANKIGFDSGPVVREALAAAANISASDRAPFDAPTPAPGEDPKITALARAQFDALEAGKIDPAAYTPQVNALFTPAVVEKVRDYLKSLGPVSAFKFTGKTPVAGYDVYVYKVDCALGSVRETLSFDAAGKISGIFFGPWNA
jgi:CubicO group peptidase (beta-lactamase class C family)